MTTSRTLLALAIFTYFCNNAPAQSRYPIPSEKEQATARDQIAQIFEKKKLTPTERRDQAKTFVRIANETDDPASRYVLFTRAQIAFVELGDVQSALDVTTTLTAQFNIEQHTEYVRVLKTISPNVKITDHKEVDDLIDAVAARYAATLSNNTYSSLPELIDTLKLVETRTRSPKVKTLCNAMRAVHGEYKNVRNLTPEGNATEKTTLGRFYCFFSNNWTDGLPLLAAGADNKLAVAAAKDYNNPSVSTDQVAVGDLWWAVSESETDQFAKANVATRAVYWYKKAFPDLQGFSKVRVNTRITRIEPPPAEKVEPKMIEKPAPKVVKLWQFDGPSSKPMVIKNKGTGWVMDMENKDGGKLFISDGKNKTSQIWKLVKTGENEFNLKNVGTKRGANIPGGSYDAGVQIVGFGGDGPGGPNVRWTITEHDNMVKIVSIHSKKALTVTGTQFVTQERVEDNNDNQLWYLIDPLAKK